MARPLRLQVADGVYHLTARGNERKAIYRDEGDKETFLEILAETLERFAWRLLSYCLMSNHYHLLVRTPQPNLARGMRDLNGVYAQAFNRRHGRDGHLFQGRYRAILIESDEHLLAAAAYVVRNPVRAGICAKPGEWPWSSQRTVVGERAPALLALDELLSYFAPTRERARELYRAFTNEEQDDVLSGCTGVIAGSDDFVRLQLAGIEGSPEIPRAHVRPPRPALEEILRSPVDSRALAVAYEHGYTMPTIAQHLGLHPSTVSRRLSRERAQIKT